MPGDRHPGALPAGLHIAVTAAELRPLGATQHRTDRQVGNSGNPATFGRAGGARAEFSWTAIAERTVGL